MSSESGKRIFVYFIFETLINQSQMTSSFIHASINFKLNLKLFAFASTVSYAKLRNENFAQKASDILLKLNDSRLNTQKFRMRIFLATFQEWNFLWKWNEIRNVNDLRSCQWQHTGSRIICANFSSTVRISNITKSHFQFVAFSSAHYSTLYRILISFLYFHIAFAKSVALLAKFLRPWPTERVFSFCKF